MIKHEKPDCPMCTGRDKTLYVTIAFGLVPDSDKRFSDVWVCGRHGVHIKEVEGTLR